MLLAWISLTLLSFVSIFDCFQQVFKTTSCVCTGLLYISSCWLANTCNLCEGVHKRKSLMSLFLLLQQCPACLVCLIWMVLEMGGKCLYSCCFVGCCFQDLFNIDCSILVQFQSSFLYFCLVRIHVLHPSSRIDTITVWKKLRFILSDRSDFHMIDNLSIAVHAFTSYILMSFSVDKMLLPRYMNLSTKEN